MSLEELQSQVKRLIGDIISKPKMSDKLLTKPPFRFLHDTISGVCKVTGFASGLYTDDMLDSASITDKAGKINYLELIFNCVSIVKGYPLDVRAAKVVAGLEPENTNTFLIAFAEVATDNNTDSNQAVQRTLSGETPGTGPPAVRGRGGGESKAESKAESKGSPMSGSNDDAKDRGSGSQSNSDSKSPGGEMTGPPAGFGVDVDNLERGKSRSGTRGSKPNRESGAAAAGLSGFSNLPPNLDDEINACDGDVETTKRLVGDLITRPKLSDKLLSKPPFRFLHDLVMEMIKVTNFGTHLYDPEESDSAQVTDKEKKMGFLDKIIKVVGVSLNTIVEARSAKIVAGLEPQNTNVFLQLFAVAAKNINDSYDSVKTVREQFGQSMPERSMGGGSSGSSSNIPADSGRERTEYRAESKNDSGSSNINNSTGGNDSKGFDDKNANSGSNNGSNNGNSEETSGPKSLRPTTARRRPPKVKDGAREMTAKDTAPTSKKTEGIMIDGAADDDDDEDDELAMADQKRLGLNMPDANANADSKTAESKLVQDIMARQAETDAAETVDEKEVPDAPNNKDSEEVQGSGIRLGARLGRKSVRKTGGRDRDSGGAKSGGSVPSVGSGSTHTPQDINRLRSAIQVLVQHTGPLGTCMDFIQEDVGLMSAELHRWEDECRKFEAEVEMEKKKSEDLLRPLTLELKDLDEQVNESISKISALKAQIARNENKVQQILKLVATS